MLRVFRRVAFLWMVCVGLAVYTAPDIPRHHLKKYLSAHQRPQYEYVNGQIPMGVEVASLALEAIDRFVPPKSCLGPKRGGVSGQPMSNPQDAFFKSSAEATPVEYINQWNEQYAGRPAKTDTKAVQVGPAVQANPFMN